MIKMSAVVGLLAIFGGLIYAGFYFKANYLEDGSYLTTTAHKADHVWRMEATGLDARVYEFRPQSDPSKKCIVWSATQKAAMQCW